ncbi:unnamed protein product, partial [Ixodes pacificus]
GHYTLDVIAKCAFGTKLDSHSNQTNEFVTRASQAFQMSVNLPALLMFYIFGIFPFLTKLIKIKLFSSERFFYFKDVCANMMKSRRESGVGPEPTLDVVSKLDYLNCVISESLRLYPPAVRLERSPVQDYVMTDTGIKLPKNCLIIIPIYAMHYDPSNFEDPYKFDPERYPTTCSRFSLGSQMFRLSDI